MNRNIVCVFFAFGLAGCASTQSAVVEGSNLGAATYTPAVIIEPGYEAQYAQTLGACRAAAENRQLTAAQEEQLGAFTDAAGGVLAGAAAGAFLGATESGINAGEGALIGAGVGILGAVVGSIVTGPQEVAQQTRLVLLRCLETTSRDGERWTVLEDVERAPDFIVEQR